MNRPAEAPGRDCDHCPRLAEFRAANRNAFPDFHNAPVASFGPREARLLVLGLAPGLKGANRTGRPFTGDYAGDLLYSTLIKFGFARGEFKARPDDGLELLDCRIANAVRCVPPENKPVGQEINTCRRFLISELAALPNLRAIVALGGIAHQSAVAATGARKAANKFGHGSRHDLPSGVVLFGSYHCSRYNTNTRRLTEAMFHDVFRAASDLLG